MPSNYEAIVKKNKTDYGERIDEIGKVLLANLYNDRTHFIYELLQNAEDALRWRFDLDPYCRVFGDVKFNLFANHLEVRHFGLPFNEEHVRGICGIVEGNKRTDLNAIGKFGIGFKSVYAYTCHPEVHSGDEHFQIEGFVRPKAAASRDTAAGETLFYLPFDHPDISQQQAFQEIDGRLRKLGHRTLLFLKYIKSIEWRIEGSDKGSYICETKQKDDHTRAVTLVGQTNDKPLCEEWLIFDRRLNLPNREGIGAVEIAFQTTNDPKTKKVEICPITDSTLVAFFATEKETHLGFLIQGPYRTTPSRDNIPKDDDWNKNLVRETAFLVKESLFKLRKMGLLSVRALEALPIDRSRFPEDSMLYPLFDVVKGALSHDPLIPRFRGGFVPGSNAKIARGTGLRELLNSSQLQLLFEAEKPLYWISQDISEDKTPDLHAYLADELGIDVITPQILESRFSEELINPQSDSWVIKLYRFLIDQRSLWSPGNWNLRVKPIIRLTNNQHISPYDYSGKPQAYLPGPIQTSYLTVKHSICSDEKALEFLRALGLKEPDIVDDVISNVLPKYTVESPSGIAGRIYKRDIEKILAAFRTDSRQRREELIENLQSCHFLRSRNAASDATSFRTPEEVYLHTEKLGKFFDGNSDIWFLDGSIATLDQEELIKVLKACGVSATLKRIRIEREISTEERHEILKRYGCPRNKHGETFDYTIEGLCQFFERVEGSPLEIAQQHASVFWDLLCELIEAMRECEREDFFQGAFCWKYYSDYMVRFDALFLKELRRNAWLPTSDGILRPPTEVSFKDLSIGFRANSFLQSKLQFKPEAVTVLAKEAGIDPAVIEFIRLHRDLITINSLQKLVGSPEELQRATSGNDESTPKTASRIETGELTTGGGQAEATRQPPVSHFVEPTPLAGEDSSPQEVQAAIDSLLGPDVPPPGRMPEELRAEQKTATTLDNESDSSPPSRANPRTGTQERGQRRLLTYVYPDGSPEIEGRQEVTAQQKAVERAGVEYVLDYERRRGRNPEEKPANHPGYDVESRGAEGIIARYIEVKSLSNSWGETGVPLSATQFKKGLELGNKYWLYVVERAKEKEPQIYRIQDPARLVSDFIYDFNWKGLHDEDDESSEPECDVPVDELVES